MVGIYDKGVKYTPWGKGQSLPKWQCKIIEVGPYLTPYKN